jgi:hypothetical protein
MLARRIPLSVRTAEWNAPHASSTTDSSAGIETWVVV